MPLTVVHCTNSTALTFADPTDKGLTVQPHLKSSCYPITTRMYSFTVNGQFGADDTKSEQPCLNQQLIIV